MSNLSILLGIMLGLLVTIAYNVVKIRVLMEMKEGSSPPTIRGRNND